VREQWPEREGAIPRREFANTPVIVLVSLRVHAKAPPYRSLSEGELVMGIPLLACCRDSRQKPS
jgi:hypothetical protein